MNKEILQIHEKIDRAIRANPLTNRYLSKPIYLRWAEEIFSALEDEAWLLVRKRLS